ncbi:MAG: FtsQ-type POTRA domain-containing protein [Candidatus Vogelbacteria bacterium]|nr:FtsQ-type POTRA domain-containing protein [Candidatus Vogelbacteria bacterium]
MTLSHREVLERSNKLRRRERSRRYYWWLALAILILASLVFMIETPWLQIKTVTVVGNKVVTDSEIMLVVESLSVGRYFYVIPKNHIVWYPIAKIKQQLSTTLPRLQRVEIYRRNFNEVEIKIVERSPLALWCVGVGHDRCFFIDQTGLVYAPAPWFSRALFFEIIGTTSPVTLPAEPVPAFYLLKLVQFAAAGPSLLATTSSDVIRFESAELWPAGDAVFTVRNYNLGPILTWQLRIDLDQDLEVTGRNLSSVWHSNTFQQEFKTKHILLDYLDVRFGNKVFYKFND